MVAAVVLLAVTAVLAFLGAMAWHRLLSQLKFTELPGALLILMCGPRYRRALHGILTRRHLALLTPLPPVKPAKRTMPPSAPARKPSAALPVPYSNRYPVARLQLSSPTIESKIDILSNPVIPVVRFQGHTATLKSDRPGEWHEGEGFR